MGLWRLFSFGLTSFGLGLLATLAARTCARRLGLMAEPRPDRWHARPTALGGGVAIFVAFTPLLLCSGDPYRFTLAVGAAAMFGLGLLDDVFHLKPWTKLLGQLAVAGFTVAFGMALPWTQWSAANQAITIVWIVGISNALNLLDNMDGLAALIAVTSAVFQMIAFVAEDRFAEGAACAGLVGALLAFLVFNWNPASVFMGDCGSLFLGYALSLLAIPRDHDRVPGTAADVAMPILILLVPIYDTTFVTFARIARRRPLSRGGRDHASHRLVALGFSDRTAVSILAGVGVLGGILGVSAGGGSKAAVWLGVPCLVTALTALSMYLWRIEKPAVPERGACS